MATIRTNEISNPEIRDIRLDHEMVPSASAARESSVGLPRLRHLSVQCDISAFGFEMQDWSNFNFRRESGSVRYPDPKSEE